MYTRYQLVLVQFLYSLLIAFIRICSNCFSEHHQNFYKPIISLIYSKSLCVRLKANVYYIHLLQNQLSFIFSQSACLLYAFITYACCTVFRILSKALYFLENHKIVYKKRETLTFLKALVYVKNDSHFYVSYNTGFLNRWATDQFKKANQVYNTSSFLIKNHVSSARTT